MAERRMFSKKIVQSSKFLKMPVSTREFYFQLGMSADDDGVVEAWNIMKLTNAREDDLRVLVAKGFVTILDNEDLVAYLNDWDTNNSIRSDRYHPGAYKDLKLKVVGVPSLLLKNNNDNQVTTNCQPSDNQMTTEVRLGKDSIDKNNKTLCASHPKDDDGFYPPEEDADSLFEEIWKLYPNKKGKGAVSRTKKQVLFRIGKDQMIRCINRYIHEHDELKQSGRFCPEWKNGSTFFNSGYVDYLDENYADKSQDVEEVGDNPWQ